MSRGRNKDVAIFTELTIDGKKIAQCKECKEKVSFRADRLRKLNGCFQALDSQHGS